MRTAARTACLCLALTGPAGAETPDCAALTATLAALPVYLAEVTPAAPQEGACVLGGLRLAAEVPGWPDLKVDRLRVGWGEEWGSVEIGALRATPKPADSAVPDWLRQVLRLQTADLTARLVKGSEGVLELTDFDLRLSGGARLGLTLSLRGVDMSFAAAPTGVLTDLTLDWRSDGRLLRPVLEAAGDAVLAGQSGDAVAAAREVLAGVVAALPDAALDGGSRRELEAAVAALPQGRGRLTLRLEAPEGIGAAGLGLAALADNPLGTEALARLFAGATITADWQPGLQP